MNFHLSYGKWHFKNIDQPYPWASRRGLFALASSNSPNVNSQPQDKPQCVWRSTEGPDAHKYMWKWSKIQILLKLLKQNWYKILWKFLKKSEISPLKLRKYWYGQIPPYWGTWWSYLHIYKQLFALQKSFRWVSPNQYSSRFICKFLYGIK